MQLDVFNIAPLANAAGTYYAAPVATNNSNTNPAIIGGTANTQYCIVNGGASFFIQGTATGGVNPGVTIQITADNVNWQNVPNLVNLNPSPGSMYTSFFWAKNVRAVVAGTTVSGVVVQMIVNDNGQ
jgi:beta-xylosidase